MTCLTGRVRCFLSGPMRGMVTPSKKPPVSSRQAAKDDDLPHGSGCVTLHLTIYRSLRYSPILAVYMKPKADVLQGTLDLLVLKTLDTMGPLHGYGIAQRMQQVSEDVCNSIRARCIPALLRLEQQGWVKSEWGISENNRKARYYSLTRSGRRQLAEERANWDRMSGAIRLLAQGNIAKG